MFVCRTKVAVKKVNIRERVEQIRYFLDEAEVTFMHPHKVGDLLLFKQTGQTPWIGA